MPKAFSFVVYSVEDIWYVFCTPMSSSHNSIVLDVWCPENSIFTSRVSCPANDNLIDFVQNYIHDIAQLKNIPYVCVKIPNLQKFPSLS